MLIPLLNVWRVLIVETAIRSVPLLLLAGATTILMRRASASARASVWRLALFGLLSLPVFCVVLPPLSVAVNVPLHQRSPMLAPAVIVPAAPVSIPEDIGSTDRPSKNKSHMPGERDSFSVASQSALPVLPARPPKRSVFAQSSVRPELRAQSGLLFFGLWVVVVLSLATRMAFSLLALRRMAMCAAPVGGTLEQLALSISRAAGVRSPVRLYADGVARGSTGPMTWGLMRPVILLPAGSDLCPHDRLRSILSHEMAHIARADWAVQILADIVTLCFWFHPLVWILSRQLRHENEQACDDLVLNSGIPAAFYAAHLLEVVRMRKSMHAPLAALSMARPSLLESRLRALLDPRRPRTPMSKMCHRLAIVGLVLALLPLAALRVSARHTPLLKQHSILGAIVGDRTEVPPISSSPSDSVVAVDRDAARLETSGLAIQPPGPTLRNASAGNLDMRHASLYNSAERGVQDTQSGQKALPELKGVAWGPVESGIQAGIRISKAARAVRNGAKITVQAYLRNTTDHYLARVYTYRGPEIWDNAGNPIKNDNAYAPLGLPGATLVVLPAGETILIGDGQIKINTGANALDTSLPILKPGKYHVGQRFLYGVPGQDERMRWGKQRLLPGIPGQYKPIGPEEEDKLTEAEALKDATAMLDKNDPIYRTHVTLLSKDGKQYPSRAVTVAAYGYMDWNRLYSPAPMLDAIKEPSDILWSGTAAFEVLGDGNRGVSAAGAPASRMAVVAPLEGQIAWGAASNGLQAGLRAPNGIKQHVIGQALKYDYIVRNVGKEEVSFEHSESPGTAGGVPDVTTADGKAVTTGGEPILASSETRHVTLKPGASVVLGHTFMGLVVLKYSSGRVTLSADGNPQHVAYKAYTYMDSRVGRFKMRHVDTLFVPALQNPTLSLHTGWTDFEIVGHVQKY